MPLKFTCPSCHTEIITRFLSPGQETKCEHCGASVQVPKEAVYVKPEEIPLDVDAIGSGPGKNAGKPSGSTQTNNRRLIKGLRIFAWIIMIMGTLFGLLDMIFSLAAMSEGNSSEGVNFVASLTTIFGSIIGGVFYMVVALMAESIFDIRAKIVKLTS